MPPETVQTGVPTVDAIAMLPLPDLVGLSAHQIEGRVCVWGGEALSGSSPVDLGSRSYEGESGTATAFPRACPVCTSRAAQGVLFDHGTDCMDCSGEEPCPVARALYRVVRLGRR